MEENNENEKFFLKIKSIEDFNNKQNGKLQNIINYDKNIYYKYLENSNIIFQEKGDINNENLKLILKELNQDMDKENNIIFPFLDICPNLIEAYIKSDLDDKNIGNNENTKSIYLETINKLKNNCFINKETLFPIYNYSSNI